MFSSAASSASSFLLGFILCLPLAGVLLSRLLASLPGLQVTVLLLIGGMLLLNVTNVGMFYAQGGRAVLEIPFLPHMPLAFNVEPLGLLFAALVSALWIPTILYSDGYTKATGDTHTSRLHSYIAIAISITLGIAWSANLVTLFICYELLTFFTYPLVIHQGNQESINSGRTYLRYLLATSMGLLLPAISVIYTYEGYGNFQPGGFVHFLPLPFVPLLVLCFMYGLGKMALMPTHRWLPCAMVAPTPVTALLHAVAVVKSGAFAYIKILTYSIGAPKLLTALNATFWHGLWLSTIAGISVLLGSFYALKERNIKRMLAYSTIAQLAFIAMLASLSTPYAIAVAFFHLLMHAFAKITLFFAAGACYIATKEHDIRHYIGIGRTYPVVMGCFAVAALTLIGLPPTAGFLSKYGAFMAAWEVKAWPVIGIITLSTFLNCWYFLPILYYAFRAPQSHRTFAPLPSLIQTSLLITTGMMLMLSFSFPWAISLIRGLVR